MAKNDCPGDGQTLPGALARRLCGEKHLEQPALVLGKHPVNHAASMEIVV